MSDLVEYDMLIRQWLKEIRNQIMAGEICIEQIHTKTNMRDLVTSVDQAVENYLCNKINEMFPEDMIIGEESYIPNTVISNKNVWIIDPIDATANFVKQRDDYAVLISYFENEEPRLSYIYHVEKDELIHAAADSGVFKNGKKIKKPKDTSLSESLISMNIRNMRHMPFFDKIVENSFDIRYIGCAGLDGVKVVTGQFGAYFCPMLQPWDYSPLLLMAKELDLHISDFAGNRIPFGSRSDVMISTQKVFDEYINMI